MSKFFYKIKFGDAVAVWDIWCEVSGRPDGVIFTIFDGYVRNGMFKCYGDTSNYIMPMNEYLKQYHLFSFVDDTVKVDWDCGVYDDMRSDKDVFEFFFEVPVMP